jgi:hypothetical protein
VKNTLIGALLLAVSAPAFAGLCTSSSNLGSLGPPGFETFGNYFTSAGAYTDCYQFTLNAPADSFGGTTTVDTFSYLGIDVTSVALSGAGLSFVDATPDTFSFGSLVAGVYELAVSVMVSNEGFGFPIPVGYFGAISTTFDRDAATQVPEPGTLTLVGAGLIGLTLIRRRKQQH